MKVLVCGGRGYTDRAKVYAILDGYHTRASITKLIIGDAKGADTLARDWATVNNVLSECYIAAWKSHGLAAGPRRNLHMLNEAKPDLVIAFPGGAGTEHMKYIARNAGVNVVVIP